MTTYRFERFERITDLDRDAWNTLVGDSGVTATLNILMMAIGFGCARLLQLKTPQAITISIETGIQNGTLAIVIATSILKQGELAVIPGVYSLIMFVTGGFTMYYFGVFRKPAEVAEPAAA